MINIRSIPYLLFIISLFCLETKCQDTTASQVQEIKDKCKKCNDKGFITNPNYNQVSPNSPQYITCPLCKKDKITSLKNSKDIPNNKFNDIKSLKIQYQNSLKKYRLLVAKRQYTGGVTMPKLEDKINLAQAECTRLSAAIKKYIKAQYILKEKKWEKEVYNITNEIGKDVQ